jgi:chromosome segregation ATPase
MVDRKRSLRPLETLKKHERSQLYEQVHEMVKNFRYESQAIRLLNFEHDQRILEEKLEEKIQFHKEKTSENLHELDKIEREKKEKFTETDLKKPRIDEYDMKESKEKAKNLNEEKQIKGKEEENNKKKQEIEEKKKELEAINHQIEIYQNFERVLESVYKKFEDYNDINDLITRYRTVKNSVDNLGKEYSEIEKRTQNEKNEFNKQINFYAEKIGSQTSLIHDLEKEIKKLKKEIADGQKSQEQNQIFEIEIKAQRAKIELTIKNLSRKAEKTKRSKKKTGKNNEEDSKDKTGKIETKKSLNGENDVEDPEALVKMLRQIEERFVDLRAINREIDQSNKDSFGSPEDHLQKSKSQKKTPSSKKID